MLQKIGKKISKKIQDTTGEKLSTFFYSKVYQWQYNKARNHYHLLLYCAWLFLDRRNRVIDGRSRRYDALSLQKLIFKFFLLMRGNGRCRNLHKNGYNNVPFIFPSLQMLNNWNFGFTTNFILL